MTIEQTEDDRPFAPKILVVDDEKRIREGSRKVLTEKGYRVSTAENGEVGMQMIADQFFDIILLDLMMPGLSGFDVLTRVKTLHPDAVIIIITGYATIENSIEAMKKGAFDFIPKPFTPSQLKVTISKAIEYTRALRDIANEKSRVRVLINHLTDGVLTTDLHKQIVLVNPAFLKQVGYKGSGEEILGRWASELVRDQGLVDMIDRALALPEDKFSELVEEFGPGRLGDDPEAVLMARTIPFRDRMDRNLGTITLLHDITALKRMDRLKSDFVSMVSHEIRSPMNSVLMQLKVLKDGLAGEVSDKQKDILERVSGKITSLMTLATDLLDLAKIESGLITQEKEKLDVAEILKDQAAFHQPRAADKKIRIDLDPLPPLAPILANRYNVEEVLSNLISNAINYSPEGSRIHITAQSDAAYLQIRVSDNGLGIPEEDLERIFDRFYRVKNEKTRYIHGTGLGLPIVKSIVEAHNGRLRVESKLDQGSTFWIFFPVAEA